MAFPYEWLVLAHDLQQHPKSYQTKQQLASVSPRPGISSSQISFTPWLPLEISKPRRSSSHLIFIAQVGWLWAKHRWGLTLSCTTQGTPEPVHPVDSYRPHWSITPAPALLIIHGGQMLVVSGQSQSLQLTGLGKSLPLICQR